MTRKAQFLETFLDENEGEPDPTHSLTDELAPIHTLFQSKLTNHDAQANLIEEYAELSDDSIIVEGGVQTSDLLEHLEPNYTTYGFNTYPRLLDLISESTNATLFKSPLTSFYLPINADTIVVFGDGLFPYTHTECEDFFKQAYESMSNQSTLLFTVKDANHFTDGDSTADVVEVGDWQIRRNTIPVRHTDTTAEYAHSYRITNTATDRTHFQFGTTNTGHLHYPNKLRKTLTNSGFTNITITKPDALNATLIIARKIA